MQEGLNYHINGEGGLEAKLSDGKEFRVRDFDEAVSILQGRSGIDVMPGTPIYHVLIDYIRISHHRTRNLAERDGLTGLYNQRYFQRQLEQEIAREQRYHDGFTLIVMDVDDFKQINDRYGHKAGDQVLKEIGSIIRAETRDVDTAARYGGDEFTIILPKTSQEQAKVMAQRIKEKIYEARYLQNGQSFTGVGTSMGITSYRPGDNPSTIFEEADKALYMSKHNGKNSIYISQRSEENRYPRFTYSVVRT